MTDTKQTSDIRDIIETSLKAYNLQYSADQDGNGYPLVDALTPAGEGIIDKGLREIELLADHIATELEQDK